LEDDCVPHPSFFRFCDELLEKYGDDERIMVVSGNNFQCGRRRTKDSYYFSLYPHCWGWATWRRAWQHYDHEMKLWPIIRDTYWLKDILREDHAVKYWTNNFEAVYEERINSWASRWVLSCWLQNGLTILPNINLVSNIGFGPNATHTTETNWQANLPVEAMDFPQSHPAFVVPNRQADQFTQTTLFGSAVDVKTRIKRKIKKLISLG
jgi:hypothetical protein